MTKNFLTLKEFIFSSLLIAFLVVGCGDSQQAIVIDEEEEEEEVDRSRSNLLKVDGKLFVIPSPIQTALLFKEIGSNYNKEMLVSPKGADAFPTRFQKALNLGVLGAGMGYVSIYDQTQDALHYLKSIRELAEDIGIMGAFDNSLMTRFEKNMGNQDSILVLVSDAYRASDMFLKDQNKTDIGVLILAGGFIESLYFSTQIASLTKNQEVIKRIGEQKQPLENLIKLLSPYYGKEEFKPLIDNLIDLAEEFDGVEFIYIYEKPIVDAANKTTTITSRTEVKITEKQIEAISNKLAEIRKKITT
jgi:hypothetical protein